MDLETENRLATLLMREAAELRRQSEKEGVLAYLSKPNVRSRPNSRFLTATVLGVQQANRAVEVNEMWRVRQKEMELDKRVKGTSVDKSSGHGSHRDDGSSRSTGRRAGVDKSTSASSSCSSKKEHEHSPEGLKDEELEEFLHSRTKRGRGAIGPRMDETGPYLPPHPDEEPSTSSGVREHRVIYGPERPLSLQSYESSEEELHEERRCRKQQRRRRTEKLLGHDQLPPGPTCWPLVGNIFQLGGGWSPHESFTKLARKHGPIMTLWLGSMCTVVVSSSEVARDMFKNKDVALAGRKVYESMKGKHGTEGSLITSQYNAHWRMLRRLCTTEFFVTSRLDAMRGVRSKCIDRMVHLIEEAGDSGTCAVDVGRFFFLMAFNLIGNLIFSKDLLDPEMERGARFYYHAVKVMEYAGKPNVADFFPILKWLDPQGIRRNTQFHVERAFEIAGWFIKQRMQNGCCNSGKEKNDFLDVLLQFRGDGVTGPYVFSPTTVNVVVFEMFTAGTDTTTSTIEWAMAELLNNPRTLKKVQMELRSKIGPDGKMEEKDIENLPYLRAVIKETLRLHPPLPFLVPHMAMDSCKILDYYIPRESQVLVNVWAIGRDPKTWDAPLLFWPERFLEPNMVDYKGHHFEFIPFGSGRRMCPAMPLASRVLPLALGSLLHSFDWVLPDGLKPEEMDMTEGMGITLRKAVPLKAIPVPYKGTTT